MSIGKKSIQQHNTGLLMVVITDIYNLYHNFVSILGSRSSGISLDVEDVDDRSRSDLGNSDNEDNDSTVSQTLTSMMKNYRQNLKEKSSIMEMGISSSTEEGTRNNNNATNRNLESMRNSLIDVEQRLKAQR